MDIVKSISVKIRTKLKANFYLVCKSLDITPMRTILILIERFSDGKIDAMPIVEDYKNFDVQDKLDRKNRMLVYRIDGGKAYRLNQKNKNDNSNLNGEKTN
jgi:antitoxin component of RelBE/YafQ-DinJ toxin-antitoxin module